MRLFSNSGCASMGYDLPAALGAAVAAPGRPIVCLAGDGSLMMNLQELQTLAAWRPDLLLVVLDNDGYLSIKQTQSNFFGREFGASPASGVTFPDFAAVAQAFGLDVTRLAPDGDWRAELAAAASARGPRVVVARLDREQEFEPRLRSRMQDGKITTPPLDDMYPHLDDDVLAAVRASALEL
jgi:acetolactate synthase-1/2/3 large subunit